MQTKLGIKEILNMNLGRGVGVARIQISTCDPERRKRITRLELREHTYLGPELGGLEEGGSVQVQVQVEPKRDFWEKKKKKRKERLEIRKRKKRCLSEMMEGGRLGHGLLPL